MRDIALRFFSLSLATSSPLISNFFAYVQYLSAGPGFVEVIFVAALASPWRVAPFYGSLHYYRPSRSLLDG